MNRILESASVFESPRGVGLVTHTTAGHHPNEHKSPAGCPGQETGGPLRERALMAFAQLREILKHAVRAGLPNSVAGVAARDRREPGISDGFGLINNSRRDLRSNPIRFRM